MRSLSLNKELWLLVRDGNPHLLGIHQGCSFKGRGGLESTRRWCEALSSRGQVVRSTCLQGGILINHTIFTQRGTKTHRKSRFQKPNRVQMVRITFLPGASFGNEGVLTQVCPGTRKSYLIYSNTYPND